MTERLLQYIWQFQYFNKGDLQTTDGEPVQVLFAGQYNTNQGPDFTNAKIKIGTTTWAGTVELHIKTGDWYKHGHQHDKNYNNVVLHVVWNDESGNTTASVGKTKELKGSKSIPVLELQSRVPKFLLQRYEDLMNAASFIPCEKSIKDVKALVWKSWKERLLAERLLRKAGQVKQYLLQNNNHWEETFWWLLARNFGIHVNADAFEAVARTIPLTILAKIKTQIHQLEAVLLGQAGLLEGEFKEDYPVLLQREYRFQQHKYALKKSTQSLHFLRMRPGNFPTIRLAQLAMLVHHSAHLFAKIKDAPSIKDVKTWFDITANDYWHYHYRFDESSAFKEKKLGPGTMDNIIINTIAPVLFAWGDFHDDNLYKEKALQWLEETTAESNHITRGFQQTGIRIGNAFDSQAMIELKKEYCNHKRCLDCGVGNALLKREADR